MVRADREPDWRRLALISVFADRGNIDEAAFSQRLRILELAGPKRLSTRSSRCGQAVIERRRTGLSVEFLGASNKASALQSIESGPQTAVRPRIEGSRWFKSPLSANESLRTDAW